ncbi:MAG: putative CRISPR-associated protein [Thermodesulfobacteriota bacterium]
MTPAHTLLCTVGTSLFFPNLSGLAREAEGQLSPAGNPRAALAAAYQASDWLRVAEILTGFDPAERLLGAEINSVHDLLLHGYAVPDADLVFLHSATADGRAIAAVFTRYFACRGHRATGVEIEGLQDADPRAFRTRGLRNLAKAVGRAVRERGAATAINATGGYKAQIAVAVLIGQAVGVPVYYKHERFSEIIAFPPMPVALDFGVWMRWSGLFWALDRQELSTWAEAGQDWDERLEPLVERVEIDGATYLELSPVGQIFHETFAGRFRSARDQVLPPPVPAARKTKPHLTDHGWGNARGPILHLLERIIAESPYVVGCATHYWNPSLGAVRCFRLRGGEIEGVWSDGTWTVKFRVDTSAQTEGQVEACAADLNGRLEGWR